MTFEEHWYRDPCPSARETWRAAQLAMLDELDREIEERKKMHDKNRDAAMDNYDTDKAGDHIRLMTEDGKVLALIRAKREALK